MHRFALARLSPHDGRGVCARVLHDLDVALLKREHGALRLLGMQRERDHRHLQVRVAHHDSAGHVHAGAAGVDDGNHVVGLAEHEQARHAERVDANVEHGATGELGVKETVVGVVLLVAAKVHLSEVHLAKLIALGTADQLAVERHMQNGRGIDELQAALVCQRASLVELLGVQGDGLLAQHVLAGGERRAQIGDVRVVRRGDVDGVDRGVGEHLVEVLVDTLHAVALGERLGLGLGAVIDASERAAGEGERLRHLVGDHAAADDAPPELRGRKDVGGELLASDRSERGVGGLGGVSRGGGLGHKNSFVRDGSSSRPAHCAMLWRT